MSAGAVPDPMSVPKDAIDAIFQWVLTGSGLDANHVIWADAIAGGPAPAGMYIEMRLFGIDTRVSADWVIPRRAPDGSIVHHKRGTRHPTLELTCFGGDATGPNRAEIVLACVTAAVKLPSVAKALRKGDVGVGSFGEVRVINGTRAVVEIQLHLKIDVSEPSKES